ncbi:MAG: CRTAC1 family protein [Planctomycetes bacterium]|nr:CRTAC1 family protein [Planctomycetota bacterium]
MLKYAFAVLACVTALRAQVPAFDLVETNAVAGPQHPGINYQHWPVYSAPPEASGVAVADVNGDTWLDLFFCGTEGRANELYINDGDGTYTESAAAYGVQETTKRRGNALFFDFDNDGDLDLATFGYPGMGAPINLDLYTLFRNDGAANSFHFTDITAACGGFALAATTDDTTLGVPGGAAAADYDRNGFIDLVVTYWNNNTHSGNYGHDQVRLWQNVPNPAPDGGQPDYTPRLLQDATLTAGLAGLGSAENWVPNFADLDLDGWPDLHVDVEAGPDELRMNQQDGTFGPNIATTVGLNFNMNPPSPWGNEMGASFADYDNDGDLDVYVTNSSLAAGPTKADGFYRNDTDLSLGGGGLDFTNIGPVTGTDTTTGIGWGVNFGDLDNDGDKELLTIRGLGFSTAPNYVWLNAFPALEADGVSVKIDDVSASVDEFSDLSGTWDNGRSLALFDCDNDGDLDAVYTRSALSNPPPSGNRKAAFFVNTLPAGNAWLQLALVGNGGSLNTVGARIWARTGGAGGPVQMNEVSIGCSFLSQEPDRQHFGLGASAEADWVAIRWLDGSVQVLTAAADNLSGLQTVNRSSQDDTGDLDGDGDADPLDLILLQTGIADEAAADAASPLWPWRQTGDLDGNGLLDSRDEDLLHDQLAAQFTDLGNALAGTTGLPTLQGLGPLQAGSAISLTLANAKPSTSWWLIIGFAQINAPFKGGVLVPSANLVIGPLPTLGGSLPLIDTWPAGLPSGLALYFQGWISDAAGPKGFAASNGVKALVP